MLVASLAPQRGELSDHSVAPAYCRYLARARLWSCLTFRYLFSLSEREIEKAYFKGETFR